MSESTIGLIGIAALFILLVAISGVEWYIRRRENLV